MVATELDARLAALLAQEEALRFSASIGAAEALALVNAVAGVAPEYDRGVGVRVYREADGMVMAQWMMDDKAPRNEAFIEGKRQAALACGHASLWMVAKNEATGAWADECARLEGGGLTLDDFARCCPAGGAFPLRDAAGDWVATVSLSGLHEGKDHELVVRALCRVLEKAYGIDVPVYPGVPR